MARTDDKGRGPSDRARTKNEIRAAAEKMIRASQGNFDHLSGQAREFARQFNLLADDVAVLYEALGLDPEDTAGGGATVGPPGATGPAGSAGADGEDGLPGIDGTPGIIGRDGTPGTDGLDGQRGLDGQPGLPGLDGQKGDTGAAGAPGPPGTDGLDGPPGPVGQNWDEGFIWIEAHDTEMTGGTAFPGGEGTAGTDQISYIEFAAATDGYATFTVVIPEDFDYNGPDGNYLSYRYFFAGSTTNSGEIWWHEDWVDLIGNDIGVAPTESEEYTHGPVSLTADFVQEFNASLPILGGSPNLAAGSIVRFTLGRVGSHISDTYTGTVKLLGIEFNYPRLATAGPQGLAGEDGQKGLDGLDSAYQTNVKTLVYNSPQTAIDGDQAADYAAYNYQIQRVWGVSEAVRGGAITVDVEVNGVSVGWAVAPTVPAAGGVGTERAPTNASVKKGDKVAINFTGTDATEGRALVKMRVVAT